jgi:hypothetical protein
VIARKSKISKDCKAKNLTRDNPAQTARITLLEVEFNKNRLF